VSPEDRASQAEGVLGAMEERVRSRRPELSMTADEIEDSPASVLLEAASRADVLVVGSHGLGTAGGFIIGSVGQEVVADAKEPVVLVRPDYREDAHGTPGGGRRRVVLGLDVADARDELMEFAFDHAARRDVPLHIVHGWHAPFFHRHRSSADAESGTRAEMAAALAKAVRPFRDRFPAVVPRREGDGGVGSRAARRPARGGRGGGPSGRRGPAPGVLRLARRLDHPRRHPPRLLPGGRGPARLTWRRLRRCSAHGGHAARAPAPGT
jgi:hypothetical protein